MAGSGTTAGAGDFGGRYLTLEYMGGGFLQQAKQESAAWGPPKRRDSAGSLSGRGTSIVQRVMSRSTPVNKDWS